MTPPLEMAPPRWGPLLGHALTVGTLALGGLSSFHALKSDVVELRALVAGLVQLEGEHTRRGEADAQRLREDVRELRGDVQAVKQQIMKGVSP